MITHSLNKWLMNLLCLFYYMAVFLPIQDCEADDSSFILQPKDYPATRENCRVPKYSKKESQISGAP